MNKEFAVNNHTSAEEIKRVRSVLGLTQKEFAELIGISKPTIERWERSKEEISGPVALLLKLIEKEPEYILKWEIPEKTLPIRMWYMYKNEKCTLIDVDEMKQIVRIKNYAENIQFRAFGNNESPTFSDYKEFLESRCFADSRDKMKLILADLNIPFYDPFLIIEKTKGKMAEDDFWIEIER